MGANQLVKILKRLQVLMSQGTTTNNELTIHLKNYNKTIPTEVLALLENFNDVNETMPELFLGYKLLDADSILSHYKNLNSRSSFFGAYDYVDGFKLTEAMYIYLEDQLDKSLEESKVISSLESYMPLFRFQGDYIVVDLNKSGPGSLITIVDGHIASYLSPSLSQHFSDLIEGIEEGKYLEIEDEVVYPTAWYQRCKVRSGVARMDEYGEVT